MSSPAMPTHRLLVRICTDSPDPRTATTLGVLVLGEHPRRTLAREGDQLDLIEDVLTDPLAGLTPSARLAALSRRLRTEHGASSVLGVWAYETSAGLRLRSSAHDAPTSHADATLLGVIYDTPHTRAATNTPAGQVALDLVEEVLNYDHWLNTEVYEWVIQERGTGGWRYVAGGVHFGHTDARIAGEDHWRQLVGPLYTETEPRGPTETAHPGGEVQLSASYTRRFVRPFSNGELHGVVDIECFVLNTNPTTAPCATPQPMLTQVLTYTVCIDPADTTATAVRSYTRHHDAPTPTDPTRWDAAAQQLCAAFDPAELNWDGQPII